MQQDPPDQRYQVPSGTIVKHKSGLPNVVGLNYLLKGFEPFNITVSTSHSNVYYVVCTLKHPDHYTDHPINVRIFWCNGTNIMVIRTVMFTPEMEIIASQTRVYKKNDH